MLTTEELNEAFARNLGLIKMQTAGLTNADTLLQPQFRANCLNWVLGHLAVNRDRMLTLLGEQTLLTPVQTGMYATDSQPVVAEKEGLLNLEELLDLLSRGEERLEAAVKRLGPEDLAREVQVGERTRTVSQRLFFFYFHETYHVGQTELLRQLAGTDDKII